MFFELLLKKINQSTILTREDVGIMKNMSFDAKILKTKKRRKILKNWLTLFFRTQCKTGTSWLCFAGRQHPREVGSGGYG
jgi:hypothetical protein